MGEWMIEYSVPNRAFFLFVFSKRFPQSYLYYKEKHKCN